MSGTRSLRRAFVVVALAIPIVAIAASAEDPAPPAAPADPWTDSAKAVEILQGYLTRMKVEFETDLEGEYPKITFPLSMQNARHYVGVAVGRSEPTGGPS